MTIPAAVRDEVRRRARFACEFCGVSETDTGGQLTVDHFRPTSQGGSDDIGNLVYACRACNQYKRDYWPLAGAAQLWNPRDDAYADHFLELEDGSLHPLSASAEFTIQRLRLNRAPLKAHRQDRLRAATENLTVARYEQLAQVLRDLLAQQSALLDEQQRLLRMQQRLMRLLHGGDE